MFFEKKIIVGRLFLLTACLCFFVDTSMAQSFKLMRYDEDYTKLKDTTRDLYAQIKYLPIDKAHNVYASFGGEARIEFAAFNNEDWGKQNIGHNNFLLQRYDLHADVHFGQRIRILGQLRSAWETGRKNGPRPIDEDKLNVQNLFVDLVPWINNDKSLTIRLGRQEIDYGSGRLISVREGPNARFYFNGAKLMLATKRFTIDAFVLNEDTLKQGAFDNASSKMLNLWGGYGKYIIHQMGNLDLYYLGTKKASLTYEEGSAKEQRNTFGIRFWKYGAGFIYNMEAAYQFGTFGSSKIKAWTGSADIGYSFATIKLKPIIGIKNDYISGDKHQGDGNLETFNPLYPKGGYFGFDPQVGPVNLIDIHPYASVVLFTKLTLQGDVVFNWRYSLQDGLYRPSGTFNLAGASSNKRYIGTAFLGSAVYPINKFLSTNIGVQYFKTGAFIEDVIATPKDGLFINARVAFKF